MKFKFLKFKRKSELSDVFKDEFPDKFIQVYKDYRPIFFKKDYTSFDKKATYYNSKQGNVLLTMESIKSLVKRKIIHIL